MATIRSIAGAHGIQPYELQALADVDTPELQELTDAEEAFLVDLVENTDEHGVYTPKETN